MMRSKEEKMNTVVKKKLVKKGKNIMFVATALVGLGAFAVGGTSVSAAEYTAETWEARSPEEIVIKDRTNYLIEWGDTLWAISEASGVSVEALVQINNIANRDLIYAGNTLAIDGQKVTVTEENGDKTSYEVNGDNATETDEHVEVEPKPEPTPEPESNKEEDNTSDDSESKEPVEDDPDVDEPTSDKPVEDETDVNTPTEDETEEPTEETPAVEEPTEDEPVVEEPTEGEPVVEEPTKDETDRVEEKANDFIATIKNDVPIYLDAVYDNEMGFKNYNVEISGKQEGKDGISAIDLDVYIESFENIVQFIEGQGYDYETSTGPGYFIIQLEVK